MTESVDQPGKDVLFLASDAHGAGGGIAQYNRDILGALSRDSRIARITVVARHISGPLGPVPDTIRYRHDAANGVLSYIRAVVGLIVSGARHQLVYCAHIRLLPLAFACAFLWRAPLVLAIYGIDAWQRPHRLLPWVWNTRIDRLITISRVTLRRFQSWSGFDDGKVAVVPNAIDLSQLTPGPKPSDLIETWQIGDGPTLMTFGRMSASERYKGFDEVIAVLPRLRALYPDIRYILCGDGDDQPRLMALAEQYGVADLCRFTGFVPADRKADYYRLADVYVMPSRGEGFGFVVIEAMACGIPAIASTTDGTFEALREGLLGTAVDPDDPPALIAAVQAALKRPRGVPDGLDYFAEPHFSQRVRQALEGLV